MTDIVGSAEDPGPSPERLLQPLQSAVERLGPAVPFFGGFGLGAAVVVPVFWPEWPFDFWPAVPLGALLTGLVYRHHRLLACAGFAAAGTVFLLLYLNLYPFGCRAESCELDDILIWGAYVAFLVMAAGGIALPGLLARGALPVDRWLRAPAVAGVIAVFLAALAALAALQLVVSPFEISLPPGWNVVEYPPYAYRDPAYGEDYTAVLGPAAAVPTEVHPPTTPVVGITVIRTGIRERRTASDCSYAASGFGPSSSRLYTAPLGSHGEVTLPAGQALELVRLPDDGARLYSWSLSRSRIAGALPLDLCYILVVAVPPDSNMTESDATAIVSAIRFP